MRLPSPPVNTIRASGKRRAKSATTVMRSADSLSEGSPRASDIAGPIAPPSTTIPSAGRARHPMRETLFERQDQGVAEGDRPGDGQQRNADRRQPPPAAGPSGEHQSRRPRAAIRSSRFEGIVKKPRTLESSKNIAQSQSRSRRSLGPTIARCGPCGLPSAAISFISVADSSKSNSSKFSLSRSDRWCAG